MERTSNEGIDLGKLIVGLTMLFTALGIITGIAYFAQNKANDNLDTIVTVTEATGSAKLNELCDLAQSGTLPYCTTMATTLMEMQTLNLAYISITDSTGTYYFAYPNTSIAGINLMQLRYSTSPMDEAAQYLLQYTGKVCGVAATEFDGAVAIAIAVVE